MFDRYNTIDEEDKRLAVDQFADFLASVDQNVDKTGSGKKKGSAENQLNPAPSPI